MGEQRTLPVHEPNSEPVVTPSVQPAPAVELTEQSLLGVRLGDTLAGAGTPPSNVGILGGSGLSHPTSVSRRTTLARSLQRRRGNAFVQRTVLQRKAPQASTDVPDEAVSRAQIDRSLGRPLDPAVRRGLEPRFGYSFSDVRVHTNQRSAELTSALAAKAFTRERDIYFAPGKYALKTTEGRRLLAHELAHVVQQSNQTRKSDRPAVSVPGDALEREANSVANAVISGTAIQVAEETRTPLLQRTPERDIISQHTTWYGNLLEDELGASLLARAKGGEYAFIERVLDELGSTDRDDVSYQLVKRASDDLLALLAYIPEGRRLLDRLFDELTSGSVSDEEQQQANRALAAKAKTIKPEEFERGVEKAKIFPYRLPGLTVVDDAPILAERRAGGKVWVRQPVRVLGTDKFREETKTLPTDVFIGGIELPENEIVGVRMYDLGGEVHYRPALYLIQLANETTTTVYQKMGEAAGLGLSLGGGALIGAGVKGASWGARLFMWADRAAFVLETLTSVIREHRGWIIEQFGDSGREFLQYVDIVNSAVLIYGGGRALIGLGQTINGFRKSYQNWRTIATRRKSDISASERAVIQRIQNEAEDFLERTNKLHRAKTGEVPAGGALKPKGEEIWEELSVEIATKKPPTAGTKPPTLTASQKELILKEARALDSVESVAGNYRIRFRERYPDFPGGKQWQVHHSIPQKFRKTLNDAGINVDSVEFLRGVRTTPGQTKNVHAKITTHWQNWHKKFKSLYGREPNAAEIVVQAREVDWRFGHLYWEAEKAAGIPVPTLARVKGSVSSAAGVAPATSAVPEPTLGRLFAKKNPPVANPALPPGHGSTSKFGDITYSSAGSATDQALALAHEQVHSFLSPRLKFLRGIRADIRIAGYQRSAFLKYLEEALAETSAQIKVHGIRRLPDGIRFPIANGYVTLSRVLTEATIGTVAYGGVVYGTYVWSSED
jgi:hypothetical protein